jgi:hypothetical protein
MFKNKLSTLIAAAILTITTVSQAADEVPTETPVAEVQTNPVLEVVNPAQWFGGFPNTESSQTTVINPAHAATWMQMISPEGHQNMHQAMTNPANYTQFMQPQFFMQMMNPQNMMSWMNPATFQAMMDPKTMSHWMQPANVMNEMNPALYSNLMNPASYGAFMNPATYMAAMAGANSCDNKDGENKTQNFFGMGC